MFANSEKIVESAFLTTTLCCQLTMKMSCNHFNASFDQTTSQLKEQHTAGQGSLFVLKMQKFIM